MAVPVPLTDPVGPLQLRVMNHLWKVGSATVQETMDATNAAAPSKPLAYTTFLTVMRNLAKRGLLDQRKTATKRHQFTVLVDEVTYKSGVIQRLVADYCGNDRATLDRYLNYTATAAKA
jgi:predicted transcriptional regulator